MSRLVPWFALAFELVLMQCVPATARASDTTFNPAHRNIADPPPLTPERDPSAPKPRYPPAARDIAKPAPPSFACVDPGTVTIAHDRAIWCEPRSASTFFGLPSSLTDDERAEYDRRRRVASGDPRDRAASGDLAPLGSRDDGCDAFCERTRERIEQRNLNVPSFSVP